MRIAGLVARILLGLMFAVFGLNGFLHFLPVKMPPAGSPAAQYLGLLVQTHFYQFSAADQLITGLMLLAGFFVPLALVLLGPVLAHILLFHILMEPSGLPLPLFAFVLWLIVFTAHRESFAGIFRSRG